MIDTPSTPCRPLGLIPALVVAVLALAVLAACAPPDGGRVERRPDVILISLDTLRADAVDLAPVPGKVGPTPGLAALAADGVVYGSAFAPMAFTLPSHMSMLAGLHPATHGVTRDNDRLAPNVRTVTQEFRDTGYRTVGLFTNEWLAPGFGFDRGFDHYERISHGTTYAPRVVDGALTFLRQHDPRPLFLFLHFMDPHSDFVQVEGNRFPYYCPPDLRTSLGLLVSQDGAEFCRGNGNCATAYLQSLDRDRVELSAAEMTTLRGLYDCGVRALDSALAVFFEELKRTGRYEDSFIVVVSDHGEEFREHGRFLHDQVYDESLHVPLLVKFPGNRHAGRRSDELVALTDLAPTLLAGAGIPQRLRVRGSNLLARLEGCAPAGTSLHASAPDDGCPPPRRALTLQDKRDRSRWALRTTRYKLILDQDDGATELYDLESDPGEITDISDRRPGEVSRLGGALAVRRAEQVRRGEDLRSGTGGGGEAKSVLSKEERNRLRALGYLN